MLSLLLCAATVALWVRSYWRNDYVARAMNSSAGGQHYTVKGVSSENGRLVFYAQYAGGASLGGAGIIVKSRRADPGWYPDYHWQNADARIHLGVLRWHRLISKHAMGVDISWHLDVPYWFLALAAGATALWCAARRSSRFVRGQCSRCGYDLRATPDRCPECGTVPAAARESVPPISARD